ncbi:MAG TPA: DNA-3-methyladenine glycosylase [Acetobacteraceae bacterium]|nr:DNA-3-methyladenine glycosylase [Acetobacteraceae bacterium]
MPNLHRLARAELPEDPAELAGFLVGKLVVRQAPEGNCEGSCSGRIVETEAYLPGDAACHAFRGRTPRNASLFLPRGHAYVYVAYGTAMMLNVSAGPPGIGAGVLLRALQPVDGIDVMQIRRGNVPLRDLARGPGRLAAALAIGRALDGIDLCADGPLFLADDLTPPGDVGRSVRIGITRDADRPLRFYQRGSRFLSGPRWLNR